MKKLFIILITIISVLPLACKSEYQLTTEPKVLPDGTDGSGGISGTYVLFGDWPQSLKEDKVKIDESAIVNVNGWDCYKGNDGYYYVKLEAKEKYYKIEPIKLRVCSQDYRGWKLLVAEKALMIMKFYSGEYIREINDKFIYEYNYQLSGIRAYLNGLNGNAYGVEDFTGKGFLNNAFTTEATEKIKTVTVNTEGCDATEDKVFLLSLGNVTNFKYGFSSQQYADDYKRKRINTDYVRAVMGSEYSFWWLRTPRLNSAPRRDGPYVVTDNGGIELLPDNFLNGVVPALVISF